MGLGSWDIGLGSGLWDIGLGLGLWDWVWVGLGVSGFGLENIDLKKKLLNYVGLIPT